MRPDQYDATTPWAKWIVRELLEHMIGVVDGLGAAASGGTPTSFTLGDDPAAQLQAAAIAMAGWRSPGVLDRIVDGGAGRMPGRVLAGINLLDTAVHTWDLATATGQPPALRDDGGATSREPTYGNSFEAFAARSSTHAPGLRRVCWRSVR